jgi:uncharacterized membrane protein affecting hemolysin expression
MSEPTYSEARGVSRVAIVMLCVAVVVAAVFVIVGLTSGPPVGPGT